MNCANHADASAVAYCRTCGKALCANCTRPVRGVIYCEDCLGAKMEDGRRGAGRSGGICSPGGSPVRMRSGRRAPWPGSSAASNNERRAES
jgi:hypothetical protein